MVARDTDSRWRLVLLSIFLTLMVAAVIVRSPVPQTVDKLRNEQSTIYEVQPHDAPWPSMGGRFAAGLAYEVVRDGLGWLFRVVHDDPAGYPLYRPSPWETDAYDLNLVRRIIVPLLAVLVTQIAPLLFLFSARRLFATPWQQACFLVFAALHVGGWPAPLVNLLFEAYAKVASWPLAHYLFGRAYEPYDMATVGLVFALVLVLRFRPVPPIAAMAGLALAGQCITDHLGLLVGVAACLHELAAGRLRRSFLVIAGAGAAAVLVTLFSPWGGWVPFFDSYLATNDGGLFAAIKATRSAWAEAKWAAYGHYNLIWRNVLAANFISLATPPILAGLALGLLSAVFAPDTARHNLAMVPALAAPAAAAALTLALGFATTGYINDLGRQTLPLMLLTIPLVAALTQRLAGRSGGER